MRYTIFSYIIRRVDLSIELDTNAHSVFSLHDHLILVVKYKRQVFDDEVSNRDREIFEYIALNYKIELIEWNHDKDHIHVLFKGQLKTELSKFINTYKSASSRLLKKEYPIIRQKLWKETFWSRALCLLSSSVPIETIC